MHPVVYGRNARWNLLLAAQAEEMARPSRGAKPGQSGRERWAPKLEGGDPTRWKEKRCPTRDKTVGRITSPARSSGRLPSEAPPTFDSLSTL